MFPLFLPSSKMSLLFCPSIFNIRNVIELCKQDIRKHSTIKIFCLDVGSFLRSDHYHSRYNNWGYFRHTDSRMRIECLREQQVNNLLFTSVESAGRVQIKNTHSIYSLSVKYIWGLCYKSHFSIAFLRTFGLVFGNYSLIKIECLVWNKLFSSVFRRRVACMSLRDRARLSCFFRD